MYSKKTIPCAFCKGTGKNPFFKGGCPVCKGRGKNQVAGKYMTCRDCRGSGQKRGTTLTCWTCGGLGMVPDRREEFKKAKKEIEKARREIDEERREFAEGGQAAPPLPKVQARGPSALGGDQPLTGKKKTKKKANKKENEEDVNETGSSSGKIFCQCCAAKVSKDSTVKVCLDCLRKIKGA